MTIEELQAKLEQIEKELCTTKVSMEPMPDSLAVMFGMLRHSDEAVQFLLDRLRAVHGLPGKWRIEFADSDAAERCASDLEAIVIQPEAQGEHS